VERHEGTPQGGPLSPRLANLLLDDLDKELERRGHRFRRYADDCNVDGRTPAEGERVMASVTRFLEEKPRLRSNRDKSAVDVVENRTFLGHRLLADGQRGMAPKSLERAKERVRESTRRNRGIRKRALSGQGWWRLARSPRASQAMNLQWCNAQGLVRLTAR